MISSCGGRRNPFMNNVTYMYFIHLKDSYTCFVLKRCSHAIDHF